MSKQGLTSDLLIGGGFITGIASIVVAFISSGDSQQARMLQSQEQYRVVVSRQYRDQLENRRSLCEAAIGYIEDDKPNLLLTGPQRQVAMDAVLAGLRNCSSEMPVPPTVHIPDANGTIRDGVTDDLSKSKGARS